MINPLSHLLTLDDLKSYMTSHLEERPQFEYMKPGKKSGFYINGINGKEYSPFGLAGKFYESSQQSQFDWLLVSHRIHWVSPFSATKGYEAYVRMQYEDRLKNAEPEMQFV